MHIVDEKRICIEMIRYHGSLLSDHAGPMKLSESTTQRSKRVCGWRRRHFMARHVYHACKLILHLDHESLGYFLSD